VVGVGLDGRLIEAAEGAWNCVVNVAGVKRGESVLVLLHTNSDLRIAEAIAFVCRQVGANVDILIVGEPTERWGTRLRTSSAVNAAMKEADVIFRNGVGAGGGERSTRTRSVGLLMKDIEGFTSAGARIPAEIIFKICELAERQWKSGKTFTVRTNNGTELTAQVTKSSYAFGHIKGQLQPGQFVNWSGGFGGLCLWPDWTANGTVAFDTVCTFEGRNRTPMKWTVENGRVMKVEGQPEHIRFIENAIELGGADANHFAEIMIGLNPAASIRFDNMFSGLYLETERHAGVMHCAVGSSTDLEDDHGGPKAPSVRPTIHLDNLQLRPTILVDGQYSVNDGRLVWIDHPEVQALAAKHGVRLLEPEEDRSLR
jgi:hypothetical protein